MAITYVGITAQHDKQGNITPLILHWPDGRKYEIDKLLDVKPAPTVGSGIGKRYVCKICNKQVNLFCDSSGKWYIKH
ncbi:hypothetical protein M7775_07730 [Sporomusa sphaeroides DSM 2875]|uniref:hypothetical protein n=1 Tax=Sporomusa sphaeroides TaxID=47679 RepID=UPI00202E8B34|nr:hypothetical protein [Sporomusa sphaeroides]MCM0758462.1 hypothetical protein [Sporomusa sphaeroides DSM 2875]